MAFERHNSDPEQDRVADNMDKLFLFPHSLHVEGNVQSGESCPTPGRPCCVTRTTPT